jgi:hypothetical protein
VCCRLDYIIVAEDNGESVSLDDSLSLGPPPKSVWGFCCADDNVLVDVQIGPTNGLYFILCAIIVGHLVGLL